MGNIQRSNHACHDHNRSILWKFGCQGCSKGGRVGCKEKFTKHETPSPPYQTTNLYWLFLCIRVFQRFSELNVRIYKRIFDMCFSVGVALNEKFSLDHPTSFTERHTIGPNALWLNPLINTLKIIHFGMCSLFVTTANGKPKRIQKRYQSSKRPGAHCRSM